MPAVILEPKKIKSATTFPFSPFICHEVIGLDAMIFECWVLSQLFHFPLSPSSRGSLVPLHFLPLKWYFLHMFSCPVVSDSLWPHGLQHARPPCPSPTPRVYSNSCPLSWWCHPTISFCHPLLPPSIFPSIKVFFLVSQLFASGGQSIGVSASTSVLPMNTQGLISLRMGWLDLLAVQGTLKSLLQHHNSKASILRHSAFFIVQLSHPHMTTGRKAMTNLDSILKSRDFTLPRKVCLVKAMVFTVVTNGCESWTHP